MRLNSRNVNVPVYRDSSLKPGLKDLPRSTEASQST